MTFRVGLRYTVGELAEDGTAASNQTAPGAAVEIPLVSQLNRPGSAEGFNSEKVEPV